MEQQDLFKVVPVTKLELLTKEELISPQNWNEKWENSIEPQTIGNFYVRPTWAKEAPSDSDLIELLIDPKMAFGTGYHATTRLILGWLSEIISKEEKYTSD